MKGIIIMTIFSNVLIMFCLITTVIVLFSFFNEKVLKLPNEIGLMAIAFFVSLILLLLERFDITQIIELEEHFRHFNLNDIIMSGFLCFLLFSGSVKIKFKDLTHDKYLISTLAFFSTLASALIYASLAFVLANFIGINLSFIQACILGSIIAPTDPISAMSILQRAGLPKRISLVMEGESLFNDGIAVALFVTFSTLSKNTSVNPFVFFTETILLNIFGAIAIGLLISFVAFWLFKRTNQKHLEVLISLMAVTGAYSISEMIEVSAPISAVVVGIYFATKMHDLHENNEAYYNNFYMFWSVVDKYLNALLYILIGFAAIFIQSSQSLIIIALSAIVIAQLARLLSIIIPINLFSRDKNMTPVNYTLERRKKDRIAMAKLLTWGGLKGGICIALALGTVNIFDNTIYSFVITSTYAVVAFSILAQGLTVKKVYHNIKDDLC